MTPTPTPHRFGELAGDFNAGCGDSRAPIVFLPGLTFDRTVWTPALRELDRIDPGRRTLTLDLPGEGESEGTFRGFSLVFEQVHAAISAAGIERPILVAHSGAAIGATLYATRYPVVGIINVDAPLENEDLAATLRALEPQLRNGGIYAFWEQLFAGLHPERSGPNGEALLRAASRPRPEVMLGYWAPLLAPPLTANNVVNDAVAHLRVHHVPYTIVLGEAPDETLNAWFSNHFPEATVTTLPGSGHFPHVAHPEAFALTVANQAAAWDRRPEQRPDR